MSFDDLSGVMRAQAAATEFTKRLALVNVAAALASGLLKPNEHSVEDAIAIYHDVLDKLQETGGGL